MRQCVSSFRLVVGFIFIVFAFVGVVARSPSLAQDPGQEGAPSGNQPEFPPIAQVTQGFQVLDGFYRLYLNPQKHLLYAEIPSSKLQKRFLIATSIAGGSYTGWQWNDLMVFWERLDRKLLLIQPEILHRGGGKALSDVVKSTYRDRVITTVPIMAASGSSSFLIDLKGFLAGGSSIFIGSLGGGVDLSITKVVKAKAFPTNLEVEFDLMSSASRGRGFSIFGGGSGSGLAVHYSFRDLPTTNYQPREADDRIGYFLTAFKDFSKGEQEDTRFVRHINRWHLEKDDPSLKLSPPKEPIIFYVEKTVPVKFRRYVHEGILEWNKAFEKIGILGAVVVRQQTDTQFNDLDPEDARYNFFRWITSESAFAMGPSRVHPETGQIFDADIIFDDAMMRSFLEDYARMIRRAPPQEFHPKLRRFLEQFPHRHPLRRWMPAKKAVVSTAEPDAPKAPASPDFEIPLGDYCSHNYGSWAVPSLPQGVEWSNEPPFGISERHRCSFGNGMRHQFLVGLIAIRALAESAAALDLAEQKPEEWPEEFVGQVLKEVVMHEVGHTLGLRHNFKASAWLPMGEINKASGAPLATSGSVMDYNPINVAPAGKPQGVWVTNTIGPYDYWAIEYGYTFEGDKANLQKIASRVAESGLAFATDEDLWSSDPLVNTFDMGSEPLDYVGDRMALIHQVLARILDRAVAKGESYSKATAAFDVLLLDFARTCGYATRFVGGNYLHRDHKGDPNERPPIQPVDAAKQRQALDLVCSRVFASDAFTLSPKLLAHLGAERWSHWGVYSDDPEYTIHDSILRVQLLTLWDFTNPRVLTLLADNELRVPAEQDAFTIPELFEKLTRAIWSEVDNPEAKVYTNRAPLISSLRRNLQHEYVGELVNLALEDDSGWSPQSARTQAAYQLEKLRERINTVLARQLSLDDYSRAHVMRTAKRIEKALEASYTRNSGSGGGGGVIIFGATPESAED